MNKKKSPLTVQPSIKNTPQIVKLQKLFIKGYDICLKHIQSTPINQRWKLIEFLLKNYLQLLSKKYAKAELDFELHEKRQIQINQNKSGTFFADDDKSVKSGRTQPETENELISLETVRQAMEAMKFRIQTDDSDDGQEPKFSVFPKIFGKNLTQNFEQTNLFQKLTQSFEKKIENFKNKIKQYENRIDQLLYEQKSVLLKKQNEWLERQTRLNNQIAQLNIKISIYEQKNTKKTREIQKNDKSSNCYQEHLSQCLCVYMSQSRLLNIHNNRKNMILPILSQIEAFSQIRIKRLSMLFRYQNQIPEINPHFFIDNVPKILLLAKLKNSDTIIGGFSDNGFATNLSVVSQGFLFKINEKEQKIQFFKLSGKYMNKTITPIDKYYIIFGNSDIRIKIGTNSLYSNFGLEISFFKSHQNLNVNSLLGLEEKRDAQLDGYEFYQIINA